MDGSRFSLQKLNNTNYTSWRFKIELLLIREDLWRYVEPGVKPNAEAADVWNAGDAKARATIGLLLEDNQHALIRSSKTAREAWLALQNHHQKVSLTSKVSLLKQICDKRYTEGEDMAEHIFAMEELFSSLANAGQKLEENLMVAMILRSLPSAFDTLTTALESRSDEDLTLELVKRKLLDEAAKRHSSGTDLAMKVGLSSRKKKTVVCHYCKKTGHIQKDCRLFIRDEREAKTFDKEDKPWIVDSGASSHTVADRDFFLELHESDVKQVTLADGKRAIVEGEGPGVIQCCDDKGMATEMRLSKALYTPTLAMNLLSVSSLVQKKASVVFDTKGCRVMRGKQTIAMATLRQGLYCLNQPRETTLVTARNHKKNCKHEWHKKFGHRDLNAIFRMKNENLVNGMEINDCTLNETCECCSKGKSSRIPFPKESYSSTKALLDMVHMDVCGPVEVTSISGYRYFLTIIDDYSRYCTLYFLKEKSDVADKIKEFIEAVKTQFGRKPKVVRSDQGGEFTSETLRSFYRREGIKTQFTTAYSPQQNGVAERRNRYLIEMGRCLLFDSGLHKRYWAEAINTAVYLQNISPTRSLKITPYEIWNGKKPEVSHLKVFGTSAWVHIPKQRRKKLDSTAQKLIFVGYSQDHKAYRFLDTTTHKIYISRDAIFIKGEQDMQIKSFKEENTVQYYSKLKTVTQNMPDDQYFDCEENNVAENYEMSAEDTDDAQSSKQITDDDEANVTTEPTDEIRRSTRATKGIQPKRYREVTGITSAIINEPRSYLEAIQCPEAEAWQNAMKEELQSLQDNQTWELVPLPPERKTVGCKWTFKMKQDENGKTVRYKARLVAQGFSQKYGTDYDEVFAPVVRQTTLRTILTIASRDKMLVQHLDIKTAYLCAELKEEVYMRPPPGFITDTNKVCRLKRSIYGLKQSARAWNQKIDNTFKKMGFKPTESDPCLYMKEQAGKRSYILIYVDDMVVCCHSRAEFETIVNSLAKQFQFSSLGELRLFLGIRIEKKDNHYVLNQASYIDKILERFGHEHAKPSKIPLDPAYVKQKEEKELPTDKSYRSLIGSLLYVAVNTRPDICLSTSLLGRKVSKPTNRDWTEAKRVLRYLKATKDFSLHLGSGSKPVECFVDADWAGNEGDRKSNSGFLIKFGGGLISWGTHKQSCVALSSTEAEFVALAQGCQELLWIRKLLNDVHEEPAYPIVVWEDNQSCIKMVESEHMERRSKHIDTKHAFTKDLRLQGIISLQYLPTAKMEADLMTKPLKRIKLERHRNAIGVRADLESVD